MRRFTTCAGMVLLALVLTLTQHSVAQPDDLAQLEAFIDGVMAAQFEAYNHVGAVVAVVKDGELHFSKGYGCADLEASTPVDPERPLFRIGSVSKLFNWTAAMQLVEEGRLDLEDIFLQRYLGGAATADSALPASAEAYARQVSGSYRPKRAAQGTLDKLFALFQVVTVSSPGDGHLIVRGLGMEPTHWVPVEPLVFDEAYGHQGLLFQEDEQGRVSRLRRQRTYRL